MESIWNYQFTKRHICKVPHVASANITFWGLTSTYYHSPTISSDVVNIWGSRCKDTLGAADSHRLWLNESVQVMTIHPWCGKARWIFLLAVAVAGYVCFYDVHGLPSGNETWLAGKSPWKGGVPRKINYTWWIFQQATFDYRKVILNQREYGIINIMPRKKKDACPHIWPLSWYPSLIREREWTPNLVLVLQHFFLLKCWWTCPMVRFSFHWSLGWLSTSYLGEPLKFRSRFMTYSFSTHEKQFISHQLTAKFYCMGIW
jgi:hypothetical protein